MNGSWRVALRLARRDLTAHRRRSFLTATLIGLPVLFAAAATALLIGISDLVFATTLYLPVMLLIVLLAIPAFAVTAKSRQDELSLLEATGGTTADLRRTITAVGLVTGGLGVAGGLVVAVPVSLGLVALINHVDEGHESTLAISAFALWPLLALLALGSSVVAALITAKTAATESDGSAARPGRRWLVVGAVAAALGALGVLSDSSDSILITVWTTLLGAGVALMTPTIVHVVSRLVAPLPLPARLAARDADRHRNRTAPAIAAVMAGVAAVTALGIGSWSDHVDGRTEDVLYPFPVGTVRVLADSATTLEAAVRAGASDGVDLIPLPMPVDGQYLSVDFAESDHDSGADTWLDVVIADADTMQGWGVALGPDEIAALDAGRALAGPSVAMRAGQVDADLVATASGEESPVVLPAVAADLRGGPVPAGVRGSLARVVVPPSLARSLGIDAEATNAVADLREPAPSAEQVAALDRLPGVDVQVQPENRFAGYHLVFGLLTLLGVGVVSLATATAVALARADGREDAATLVSVGARPATTRWSAAVNALLIGGTGSVLGLLVGVGPGARAAIAMTRDGGEALVAVPWALLAIVAVVVPLVIAAIAFATAPVRTDRAPANLR